MTRRNAFLAVLLALCAAVLPACAPGEKTVGGASGPVTHHERALVLSVDAESQTAEVRILARPDDLTLTWGTLPVGSEGMASFAEWGADTLPAEGDDVVLDWVGAPAEKSAFPLAVESWQHTVRFYEELGDAREVRLSASMLRFFSMDAAELAEDLAEDPDLALAAQPDGEDLVLTFTSAQLARYRSDVEQSLADYVTSLEESGVVTSIKVGESHAEVTIVATPELLDKPMLVGEAFMGVPGMCVTLQALDGITDWRLELTVVDAEKNVEVARVALPEESMTLSPETWADAVE